MKKKSKISNMISRGSAFMRLALIRTKAFMAYCTTGVWSDTRRSWRINTIKTINLTVRSFLNTDLQNRASALTYNTLLAIVPALALLFAIGRGFGFENLLQTQLFQALPSQKHALEAGIEFVSGYMQQASQGLFVGVGIVVLLWTMISLMSNIEDTFNTVWGVTHARSFGRKVIDYTAIMFLLPILMICSSGISVMASYALVDNPRLHFITPALKVALDVAPFVLTWMSFTGMYLAFPNTKVRFKNAFLSGIFAGTAFQILQYLFLSGQIYVSKYNAIYGSFAFLPLMLIWLQLSWLILLTGCVLTYSLQNVFAYNYMGDISDVSQSYRREVELVITALVFRRFRRGRTPYTLYDLSKHYDLPMKLVNHSVEALRKAGIIYIVSEDKERVGIAPAVEIGRLSVGELMRRLDAEGNSDFIPGFSEMYAPLLGRFRKTMSAAYTSAETLSICDLPLPDAINTK